MLNILFSVGCTQTDNHLQFIWKDTLHNYTFLKLIPFISKNSLNTFIGCFSGIFISSCFVFLVDVRLRGVNSSRKIGRVEISLNGFWGTICDESWNIRNAHVICRMLGFHSATAALGSAVFGRGHGFVWLHTLNCTGNESSILECKHGVFGSATACRHYSVSGVMCGVEPCKLRCHLFLDYKH